MLKFGLKSWVGRFVAMSLAMSLGLGLSGFAQAAVKDKEVFKDWTAQCAEVKDKDGKAQQACQISQVSKTKDGRPVMTIEIGYPLGQKEPMVVFKMLFVANYAVNLNAGLGLAIDEGKVVAMPFNACGPQGCLATAKLSEDMVATMKKGKKLNTLFATIGGKRVRTDFSLSGFTKAINRLKPVAK